MWNPSFKGIKITEAYIPISTNDPAQKIKKNSLCHLHHSIQLHLLKYKKQVFKKIIKLFFKTNET